MLKNLKRRLYIFKLWYFAIFKYPPLKIEKVDYDTYWKDKRGDTIGRLSDWQKERADLTLTFLEKDKPISIADIGGGDGSILKYIRERTKLEKGIIVDISDFALNRAREFGFQTVKMDITNMNELVRIPAVDYILLYEILEHIPHSEVFLEAAYGKVSKAILFSFPNTGFFTYRLRLLFGKFPLQWRLHPGEHVRYWTAQDLRWWLRSLGYKNYSIRTYKGMPLLKRIWPSLFAAGFLVRVSKHEQPAHR
jgi:2-polyprenyl-3-methyl-5-hydroxy-6-metoxy-1,4-benzoquinol methylase